MENCNFNKKSNVIFQFVSIVIFSPLNMVYTTDHVLNNFDEAYILNERTLKGTFRTDRCLGFALIETNAILILRTKPVN